MSRADMQRRGLCLLISMAVPLLSGSAVLAQPIPSHPRELVFDDLSFEPPSADEHRFELSNGVVVYVVPDHSLPFRSHSMSFHE